MYDWVKRTDCYIDYDPNLWEKRNIHAFTQSGSVISVPRDCKQCIFWTNTMTTHILRQRNDYKVHDKPSQMLYMFPTVKKRPYKL